MNYNLFYYIAKGKVHTTTGHDGPEGEERYSSTLPLTLALGGGGWSMPCPTYLDDFTYIIINELNKRSQISFKKN